MRSTKATEIEQRKAVELTKMALESLQALGLTPSESTTVLGIATALLTELKKGKRVVDGLSGEAERADALVRVTRRLNVLLPEGPSAWRSWLRRENPTLGTRPLDVMLQRDGVSKMAGLLERSSSVL